MAGRAMSYKFDPTDAIAKMIGEFDAAQVNVEGAIESAVEAGGKIIEAEQKRMCPVKTGKLRDSISRRAVSKSKDGHSYTYIGVDFEAHPKVRGEAVANEFGRRAGKDKNGKKVGEMQARSYVRAGFDSAADRASTAAAEAFCKKVGLNK